jgi:repressor LexA
MKQLTKQQQNVFDFIRGRIIARGYGPTVREIADHMGISSPNGVICHLRALEKKGMIIRSANKSRAIELSDPPFRGDLDLEIAGTIQQGTVQLSSGTAPLKLGELLKVDEQFLLTVRDDQLVQLNIKAGDQLLVCKQLSPTAGQLVVAQNTESGLTIVGQVQMDSGRPRVTPLVSHPMQASTQTPLSLLGVVIGVLRFL